MWTIVIIAVSAIVAATVTVTAVALWIGREIKRNL
jgi:hypothetical protein